MNRFRLMPSSGIAIIFLISTAVVAGADEQARFDITGWIDREETTWIIQSDHRTPSAVFSTIRPGLHQFRIHAYSNERYRREGSVYLELVIRDGEVSSTQIQFFPFAPLHPRFSFGQDHGTGQLTLHSLEIEAGNAHLVASFAGELYYHQSPNTQPIPHRTRPMRIDIDLVAVRD